MSSAETPLEELNHWLRERGIGAYWMRGEDGLEGPRPRPRLVKHAEVYPALFKAGKLVPVGPSGMTEMRTLGGIGGAGSISLGYQVLMPVERTRAHRNIKNEIRFVLEAPSGAVFVVENEAFPMEEGDLITAPTWTTHDHWNNGDRPAIWLDGLDMGLMRFGTDVNERYPEDDQFQAVSRPADYAYRTHGHVKPAWIEHEYAIPPMRYPWSETCARLMALKASEADGDPCDGICLRYANPVDGGATVRTMSCEVSLLLPGIETKTHRHASTTLYYAFQGEGCTVVEGERVEWSQGDLFNVPSWTWHHHENAARDDAILYSVSDWPAMQALGFYREEMA